MTHRHVLAASVTALALLPASAQAATLKGTVVGEPGAKGVPVLLGEGSRSTAKLAKPLVRVVATSIRTRNGKLAPGALRVGDTVSYATSGRVSKTKVLRVQARGTAPSFATLTASREATRASATKALTTADDLLSGRVPNTAPDGNEKLRTDLIGLRTQVNFLIADLRTTGSGFSGALTQITAARPADAVRAAAVAKLQAPFLTGITQARDSSLTAADKLDDSVAALDERINAVGDASAPSLPVGSTSTASDVIHNVLDVLRQVQLPLVPGA